MNYCYLQRCKLLQPYRELPKLCKILGSKQCLQYRVIVRNTMKRTFFRTAEPRWMFTIIAGLGMLIWSWLSPGTIPGPYGLYLGPVGMLGKYLGENFPAIVSAIVYIATFLHIGEAVYAAKLCWDHKLTTPTALKWVFQTLIFGVASLRILRSHASKV